MVLEAENIQSSLFEKIKLFRKKKKLGRSHSHKTYCEPEICFCMDLNLLKTLSGFGQGYIMDASLKYF